jgi:PPM family protein phosphatase
MIDRACCSDPGKPGRQNQDACSLPNPGADEKRLGTLLAIADGTGGLPGGGEASQEAINYLQALYYAAPHPNNLPDRLRQSVEEVNALNRLARRRLGPDMGHLTTLVAAVIQDDQIWVANVGDSRAFLAQAASQQILQLTEDNSVFVRKVKAGLVNETDIDSRDAGVITRAIGLQDDCQVDIYHYTWSLGDRLILASDGLSHLVPEDMLSISLASPPEKASHDLVAQAIAIDGSDNCTAVVAAWLQTDAHASGSGSGKIETIPDRPSITVRSRDIALTFWGKLSPASRFLILGVLMGWLSAGILIILLELSGAASVY